MPVSKTALKTWKNSLNMAKDLKESFQNMEETSSNR